MMRTVLILLALTFNPLAVADINGLVTIKSNSSVKQTINKLETVLKSKGITIVTRWSHDQRAKSVGIKLRPTELLIFGNPALGSHFITSQQSSAIDLPLKALAWQDENGVVWLSYNDPAYIAKRHNIKDRDNIVNKITAALQKFSTIASSRD